MKKRGVLGLFVLGLFAIFLMSNFVSAADPISEFFSSVFGPIFESWSTGEGAGEGFARFLFGVIIALLVYIVLDSIPGLGDEKFGWARVVLAVIVAYFGTAYLKGAELQSLLLSYSGLGFALGTIFPFLILVMFSYKMIVNNKLIDNDWVKRMLLYVLWGAFLVFIVIRLWDVSGTTGEGAASGAIILAHWIMILGIVAGGIFMGAIIEKVHKSETDTKVRKSKTKMKKAAAFTDQASEFIDDTASE
jgi:hypothetical protein